jgi:hypothetical protein
MEVVKNIGIWQDYVYIFHKRVWLFECIPHQQYWSEWPGGSMTHTQTWKTYRKTHMTNIPLTHVLRIIYNLPCISRKHFEGESFYGSVESEHFAEKISSKQVNNSSPYSTLNRRAGQPQSSQQDSAELYDQIHLSPYPLDNLSTFQQMKLQIIETTQVKHHKILIQ